VFRKSLYDHDVEKAAAHVRSLNVQPVKRTGF
jgi:hypothetical protein